LLGNEHALDIQKLLAQYGVALGNTTGQFGDPASGSRDLVRAAEQMGRLTDKTTGDVDMAKFGGFADLSARIFAATEGQVGAKQLNQLATMAGPALGNMTDRGIAETAILSQYMTANRAGTAIMSMNQQFAGGTMWSRNAEELQRLGILHEGEWHKGGGGGIVMTPEARQRLGKALTDPMNFVVDQLIPAMEKAGIVDQDAQVQEVYSILGRQTSQRAIADIIRNHGQMGLELGRLDKGQGLAAQLATANDKDAEQNLQNLSVAWKNLMYALAGPNSENAITVLKSLTSVVDSLTNAARNHPEALKLIAEGIAGLGAALMVGGGVALLAALGPVGWFAAGITAIGIAVVAYWSPIKEFFAGVVDWIKNLFGLSNSASHTKGASWQWQDSNRRHDEALNKNTEALKGLTQDYLMRADPISYSGSGISGGGLIQAMFTDGGSIAVGRAAASMGRRGSGGSLGSVGSVDSTGNSSLTGNAYIASVRSRFAQELNDPNKRLQFAAMLLSEGNPLQTAESAMNRSDMTHNTLMQALHGGFYGPVNRGQLPKFMRELQSNPKLMARMNAAINSALAGSDAIRGFTDQGMRSDPNGAWIMRHDHLDMGGNLFGDWGGGRGHDAAEAWRHNFESHAGASGAIPPREDHSVNINQPILLDGHVIANTTMKHIVGHGNSPQSGARSPDYLGTRPLSI
jgi:hypothetical protein